MTWTQRPSLSTYLQFSNLWTDTTLQLHESTGKSQIHEVCLHLLFWFHVVPLLWLFTSQDYYVRYDISGSKSWPMYNPLQTLRGQQAGDKYRFYRVQVDEVVNRDRNLVISRMDTESTRSTEQNVRVVCVELLHRMPFPCPDSPWLLILGKSDFVEAFPRQSSKMFCVFSGLD